VIREAMVKLVRDWALRRASGVLVSGFDAWIWFLWGDGRECRIWLDGDCFLEVVVRERSGYCPLGFVRYSDPDLFARIEELLNG